MLNTNASPDFTVYCSTGKSGKKYKHAGEAVTRKMLWSEFVRFASERDVTFSKDDPGTFFCGGVYGDSETGQTVRRKGDPKRTMLVIDIDKTTATAEEIEAAVRDVYLGHACLIYSTFSDGRDGKTCCRVVLPLADIVSPEHYKTIALSATQRLLVAHGIEADACTTKPNQLFHTAQTEACDGEGSDWENPSPKYRPGWCVVIEGIPLATGVREVVAVDDDLDVFAQDDGDGGDEDDGDGGDGDYQEMTVGDCSPPLGLSDDEIHTILAEYKPEDVDYHTWIDLGMRIHHETGGSAQGLEHWREWSKTAPGYKPSDHKLMGEKWTGFGKKDGSPVTLKSLMKEWQRKNGTTFGSVAGIPVEDEKQYQRLMAIAEKYAIAIVGGRTRYLATTDERLTGQRFRFLHAEAFKSELAPLAPFIKRMPMSDAFIKWDQRPYYKGLGFWPDGVVPDGYLNLFNGYRVEPEAGGDIDPFLTLVHHLCKDSGEDAEECLLNWLAHMFQCPSEKPSFAVLIYGVQGSGKGTLYRTLHAMLGHLAIQLNGSWNLTGRFNAVLEGRLLVYADEVDLGTKGVAGRLKAIITEPNLAIERKNVDVELMTNYTRLLFACNTEDSPLFAESTERRYLVIETPEETLPPEFFSSYAKWLKSSAGCLLHYLMNRPLTQFSAHRPVQSDALRRAKVASIEVGTVLDWICHELESMHPFGLAFDKGESTGYAVATEIVKRYSDFRGDRKLPPMSLPQMRSCVGKTMRKIGVKCFGRPNRGDGVRYYFPPMLDLCNQIEKIGGVSPSEWVAEVC